jgi:hypothetical protein
MFKSFDERNQQICCNYRLDTMAARFGQCKCGFDKLSHSKNIGLSPQMEERLERFNSMSEKEKDDEYKKMVEDREKQKDDEKRDYILKYGFDAWDKKIKKIRR